MAAGSIIKTILDSLGVSFNSKAWSSDGTAAGDTIAGFVQFDPTTMLPVDQTQTVNVAQDTNSIKNGATSLTPKFAKIALAASGDLVALVATKKIRVLAYNFIVAGATTVKFQSNAATDLTGVKTLAANGGLVAGFCPVGHFETAAGEKLNLVLGTAVVTGGELTYVEV